MNHNYGIESLIVNDAFGLIENKDNLSTLNQLIDHQYGQKNQETSIKSKKNVPKLTNLEKPDLSCLLHDDICDTFDNHL